MQKRGFGNTGNKNDIVDSLKKPLKTIRNINL